MSALFPATLQISLFSSEKDNLPKAVDMKWVDLCEKPVFSQRKEGVSLKDRLLRSIVVDANGCWLWQLRVDKHGYGLIKIEKRDYATHRVAYAVLKSEDPGKLYVCHHCDVRHCINSEHLFSGTARDNVHDMIAKGRNKPPPRTPPKLNDSQLVEIRKQYAAGALQREIAERFGVGKSTISNVISERSCYGDDE